MSSLVSFQGVTKEFKRSQGFRRERVLALDDVSFSVNPGEFVGLIGHNGAGKSTSIKLIMGFIRQNRGQVLVRERLPSDVETRRSLGYVPENSSFSDFLTGWEILDAFGKISDLSKHDRKLRGQQLLESLDIAHAGHRLVKTYSKGMTQRLAIAQALMGRPDVLILDEPMTGLDPLGRRQVLEVLLEELKRGVSLVFCSHLLADVQQLCERVLWLHQGRVRFDGALRDLVEDRAHYELTYRGPSAIDGAESMGREFYRVRLQPEDLQATLSLVETIGGRVESFQPATRALEEIFVADIVKQ